ncbi:MAG: TonB-dependent receptor [Saprospiraceae bacterium]|nr:TonB-dependent receptor [Saprospiraceae bacterium]
MKKINYLVLQLSLLLMGFVGNLFAQGSVSGIVKDNNGEAVPFAIIQVLPSMNGVSADIDGNYKLENLNAGTVTLKISSVGYAAASKEVTVENGRNATLDVMLESDVLDLSQVVVTGVANEKSKLESSVSISTLSPSNILSTGARTTTEIFRSIPGIRSESSGGEGNTNIASRGAPISSGGSKYLQLQEDGLPVLMFGDIAFATADIFLRADQTVSRIEAIRGGSSSTSASNAPAGIINFISKTGAVRGGIVSTSVGLDYRNLRTDFNVGTPINDNLTFNVGGFFRQGDGQRTAGYTANQGGQIKANLTRTFDNGYIRVYYKYLNDRAIAYMPMPMKVTGTNSNPTWGSIDGYDVTSGTMHSPYMLRNNILDQTNNQRQANVADGMHPVSNAIGVEFNFDLDGWKIEDRVRYTSNRGRFITPFPAEVGTASALATSVADLRSGFGATGTPGLVIAGTTTAVSDNTLALRIHMFDTELNNFDNMMNDFKISKTFGKFNATLGYFNSLQNINMSWLWNSYITELKGDGARMLDVVQGGTLLSQNGLYAYGVPAWGNCCQRNYNTQNVTTAPYVNLDVEITDKLNFDASARYDIGRVTGTTASAVQSARDMNGDGIIQAPETSVSSINNANASPVNYTYEYLSYSIGANYKIKDNMAVFARHSYGGSAKADRILFSSDINPVTGGLTENVNANGEVVSTVRPYDLIRQTELGLKYRFKKGGLFLTLFQASTDEVGGFEATTQKYISNSYNAIGAELEAAVSMGGFDLRGGLTFTNAKISKSANADVVDNTPRRLPALMLTLTPIYNFGKANHQIGLNIYGTSSAYAQDNNELVLPAYLVLNPFVNFNITSSLSAGVSMNNALNAIGVTESEEGSITDNQTNYVRARPIMGRSTNLTLSYKF